MIFSKSAPLIIKKWGRDLKITQKSHLKTSHLNHSTPQIGSISRFSITTFQKITKTPPSLKIPSQSTLAVKNFSFLLPKTLTPHHTTTTQPPQNPRNIENQAPYITISSFFTLYITSPKPPLPTKYHLHTHSFYSITNFIPFFIKVYLYFC